MLLSDFHDRVKKELNRGDAFDADIPGRVRQAVNWIERNYTLSYMKNQTRYAPPSTDITRVYVPYFMKKPRRSTLSLVDGTVVQVIQPYDIWEKGLGDFQVDTNQPYKFEVGAAVPDPTLPEPRLMLRRVDTFPTPNKQYLYHWYGTFYTANWPGAINHTVVWPGFATEISSRTIAENDNYQHWLLDFGADVLLAETMRNFMPTLRRWEDVDGWVAFREDALVRMLDADAEMDTARDDSEMKYSPVTDDYQGDMDA